MMRRNAHSVRRVLRCAGVACAIALGAWPTLRAKLASGQPGVSLHLAPLATHDNAATESLYTSNAQISARFLDEDITPDGDLWKPVWKRAHWIEIDHDMSGQRRYAEARTRVAALWSTGSVYFAFFCRYVTLNTYHDEDVTKERWELWNRDVVEVFVNPQPGRLNHYFEFEVAPNNQWIDLEINKDKNPFNDASWDSHFQHATRVDAVRHEWTCEMRIPIASLGVAAVSPGDTWRVNLFRADGPGSEAERRVLAWSTISQGTTFHVPSRFGLLRFVR